MNLNTIYGWFFLLDLLQLFQKVCVNLNCLTIVDQQVCLLMHELHYNAPTSDNDFVVVYEGFFMLLTFIWKMPRFPIIEMQMFGLNGWNIVWLS